LKKGHDVSLNRVEKFTLSGLELQLRVDPEKETVWASQADIEDLFGVGQSTVSRHIRNVFQSEELNEKSNMQKMHIANSDRPVTLMVAMSEPSEKELMIALISRMLSD
jgi:hypothetical protein